MSGLSTAVGLVVAAGEYVIDELTRGIDPEPLVDEMAKSKNRPRRRTGGWFSAYDHHKWDKWRLPWEKW